MTTATTMAIISPTLRWEPPELARTPDERGGLDLGLEYREKRMHEPDAYHHTDTDKGIHTA